MNLNQYLQLLEKMKDLQIVKFFSQFFTEAKLSPLVGDLKGRAAGGTVDKLATELIVWAVILAVGAFAIDQAFYWTRPGQIEKARENWQGVKDGAVSLVGNVRAFVTRSKSGAGRHGGKEDPRGRS